MKRRMAVAGKQRSGKMGTLALATLAACSGGAAAANAQNSGYPSGGSQKVTAGTKVAAAAVLPFAIPAGSLALGLDAYRQATGYRVEFLLQGASVEGFHTSGVSGSYTAQEALKHLLAESGLTFEMTAPGAVRIGLKHSDSVDVTAGLPDGVAMTKFSQPLLDTPQTVDAIPHFVLEDQGTSTLRDALRNVPGISLAAGEAGAQGDNLTIRGFTARNDIFLDGIRDFGSYYRDSFNYEQVEVLEGPAGVDFGRGSTGGVINQESKVPQAQQHTEVDGQFGTNLNRRLTVDFNQPIAQVPGAAFRINAMVQDSGVAGRPFAEVRRFGLAPSLTFGLNSPTRFTLNYFHLTENDTPDYGLPWFYNKLAPGVSRYSYFGFADENYLRTSDDILTARVDHDFGHGLQLHSIARAANYPRQAQITEPQICTNASVSVPVGGYVSALPTSSVTGLACSYVPGQVDPATILVNRNQIQVKSVEGDLWDQTELTARFKTFGIRHEFSGGVEGGQEISNPIRYSYQIKATGSSLSLNTVPSTTLLNPNTSQVFGGTGYITSIVHTKAESVGIYFVDTLHLNRYFDLSGGVRWDRFDTGFNGYQPTPPAGGTVSTTCPAGTTTPGATTCATSIGSFSRVDAQPTYRAAFVYKPNVHGSVYFDYGTSFNPSAESLALSSVTQNVAPEENETYEVGAKYSFMHDRLMAEGAWFRTEKDNARETDPNNSNNIVVAGNQLVKGVQASVIGRLPRGMDVVAGYAYLSSAVIYSPFYPTSVGYQLANVPKQTFNTFVTHSLPGHFSAGFGGNYVASRTASSTTPYVPLTFGPAQSFAAGSAPCGTAATTTCYQVLSTGMKQVPGYWVFNGMIKRTLTDHLEAQANVNNLLNRFFIDEPHPSHLVPGEGLNAQIGLNYKF